MLQKDYGLFLVGLAITLLVAVWLDRKYNRLHTISLACCAENSTTPEQMVLKDEPTRREQTIKQEFNL